MAHEGLTMSALDSSDKMAEEIREVEEELASPVNALPLSDMEEGRSFPRSRAPSPLKKDASLAGTLADYSEKTKKLLGMMGSPVFAQAFVLTFLGEWGDRSQIATIALAAAHVSSTPFLSLSSGAKWPRFHVLQNLYVIAFGTILGHGLCTAGAVIGGRWLSTKISVRYSEFCLHSSSARCIVVEIDVPLPIPVQTVTLIGAFLFLIFSILYFREAYESAYTVIPPSGAKQ